MSKATRRYLFFFSLCLYLSLPSALWASAGLERAEILIRQGVFVEAIRELKGHLEKAPDDFSARLILAETYLKIEDYTAAIEQTEILDTLRPGDQRALELKTEAKSRREDFLYQKVSRLEAALVLDPADHESRIMLGDALAEIGEYEKAALHYSDVIRLFPEDAGLKLRYARFLARIEDIDGAVREYRDYLELEDSVSIRLELASTMAWEGRFAEAMDELDRILSVHPEHIEARMLAAGIHLWSDNFDQAEELYLSILSDRPGYGPAEEGLAGVYEARDRMEEVVMPTIDELEEELRINPGNYEARLMLGRLLSRARRFREAAAVYSRYLREYPDDFMVRLEYASALGGLDDLSGAAEEYRKYLEHRPDDLTIRFELARRLVWMGSFEEAERELEVILESDPQNIQVIWEIAQIKMRTDRIEEALENYYAILEINPSNRAAEARIAIIETSPRFLITQYRSMVEEHPDDLTARILLSKMLIEAGRYFEAKTELSIVLRRSPGHPEAGMLYRQADNVLQRQLRLDIAELREIVRKDPQNYNAQLELARLLQAYGRNAEAIARYEIYLRRFPDDYEIRREYADFLSWNVETYGQAKREYEYLIMMDPENIELRLAYARILQWDSSSWIKAHQEILTAMFADPADPVLHVELGRVYTLRGRFEEAQQAYESALNLDPYNTDAMQGISEIERLTRPRISGLYARMSDNTSYRESQRGLSGGFYIQNKYLVSLSVTNHSFSEFFPVPPEEDEVEDDIEQEEDIEQEMEFFSTDLTRYTVSVETSVDLKTRASVWLGVSEYTFYRNSVHYGIRGDHDLDSRNRIGVQYSKYDAIHDVKTVRSLLDGIEIDNLSVEWEYSPEHTDEGTPFLEMLSFLGYASYATYSDANRHNLVWVKAFYPLRHSPAIDVSLGYSYLRFLKDSEFYWSPASHSGPTGALRIRGRWRNDWSYGAELESAFIQATSNTQRGISLQLFRDFSDDFSAGVVVTRSEVPREEEEMYKHNSIMFEASYRF